MTKTCDFCAEPFSDKETIVIIADAQFKLIPSRVHYGISLPSECREMYHRGCFSDCFGTLGE
jgi:hypothetical protein